MKKIFEIIKGNFYLKNISLIIAIGSVLLIVVFLYLKIYTHHGQALSVPNLKGMTLEEAKELLEKRKLRFEVIDSVYMTDAEKGVIVEHNPEPEFKVKKNRTIFVTINANTAEKVIMPNLIGFSYRQATAELTGRGLKMGKLIYFPDIAKNMVLKQRHNGIEIQEGDTIEKGSVIDLVIGNGGSNQKVWVPDLTELSLEQAKDKLNETFLNLGAKIFDSSVLTGEDSVNALVYMQKPGNDKKSRLPMGDFVDLWLTVDSTKMPGYDSLMYIDNLNNESLYEPEKDK